MNKATELNKKIEENREEIRQLENRQKVLLSKKTTEERKAGTKRFYARGAILEKTFPQLRDASDDEVAAFLANISKRSR